MDEMNVLNAPKKVVDGLTEVFEGLAQMFEGVSDQLELLGADAASEDKRIFPIVDQEAPAVSEKVQQHRIPARSRSRRPERSRRLQTSWRNLSLTAIAMPLQTHSQMPRTVPGKQRKKKTSRRMMPMIFRGARIPGR